MQDALGGTALLGVSHLLALLVLLTENPGPAALKALKSVRNSRR
jgi:hypothetical protein